MSKGLRALFVGDLNCPSASGRQRLWALQACGVEVESINKQDFGWSWPRLAGRSAKLLRQPRLMRRSGALETALVEKCRSFQPHLLWLEWPREISSTILGKLPGDPFRISFQDDNPWGNRHGDRWMWKGYFKAVPEFDLHLVKRKEDKIHLSHLGAKACRTWEHGVYAPFFHPSTASASKTYPVSFVGTCMDERAALVAHLLEAGIPLHIFGTHWEQRSDLPARYPDHFHPAVRAEAYAEVIRQSQISLGLVSHSNHDEWTLRSYDVPGCGGLLLAERTPTHERWFEEGKEALFFSSPEECVTVLRQALADPQGCEAIGRAALQKCRDQAWFLENRMQELLEEILPHLHPSPEAASNLA